MLVGFFCPHSYLHLAARARLPQSLFLNSIKDEVHRVKPAKSGVNITCDRCRQLQWFYSKVFRTEGILYLHRFISGLIKFIEFSFGTRHKGVSVDVGEFERHLHGAIEVQTFHKKLHIEKRN